jgi:predicted enzyme related to lactoylglutathione lyase
MSVTEMFFAVSERDMERAKKFYVEALEASVIFAVPQWTSLRIAGVRLGLFADSAYGGGMTGLHFAVSSLAQTCASIERAGGRAVSPAEEVAPGVVICQAADTEGNVFVMRAD